MSNIIYPATVIHNLALDILNDKGRTFRREGSFCLLELREQINLTTDHIKTFVKYGTRCFHCGIGDLHTSFYRVEPIQYSKKEIPENKFRLQLYVTRDGIDVVPMTTDHVIPRAIGGKKRSVNNWQPLCYECNQLKGHVMTDSDILLAKERGLTLPNS